MIRKLTIGSLLMIGGIAWSGPLIVVPTEKHQTIEGIGAALAMCEGWIVSEPYKEELYDTLFKATGISILRLGNWLQDTTADLTTDSTLVAEYRKRNPYGKVLVSSWTPPSYLKANNSDNGNTSPNSLKKVNGKFVYDQFGHWWKSSIRRFNKAGINPDYITIQNEINWNTDYGSCLFEATENDTIAAYAPALSAVHDSISTLDRYPLVLGPEVLGTGYGGMEYYAKTMTDTSKFYGWAFHFYGSGDYNNPPTFLKDQMTGASFSELKKTTHTKPSFMTEYCNLGGHEADAMSLANPDTTKDWLNLAWIMQEAFTVLDLNAWVFWDIAWQGNSSIVAVLPFWDPNSWPASAPHGFFVRRMLPALGQYSRFVRGGWVRIDANAADTALKVSAFLSPQADSVSIVIVNPSFGEVNFTPGVIGSEQANGTVWTTSPTHALQKTGTWKSGTSMSVPARSITTLYGSIGPTEPGATFYQFGNFGGLNTKLSEGNYTLSQLQALGIPNNAINSMKVDTGLTVELFDEDNFTVLLGAYNGNVVDFDALGFANKVTSIRISKSTTGIHKGLAQKSPISWSSGTLFLGGVQKGRVQIINKAGRSWFVDVSEGRANTGILPPGSYHVKIFGKHPATYEFSVLH